MSVILASAAAIVEAIRAGIPELAMVRTYHAPIDGEEIAREFQKCPAGILIFSGGAPTYIGGDLEFKARWTLCIVTDGMDPQKRTALGVALAEKAFRLIDDSDFGGAALAATEELQMRTLYTGQLDERAISIITISWAQDITLAQTVPDADLTDFLGIRVDFTLPKAKE